MNIVFFGSSGFSVPPLRSICERVTCVVTKRSKPKGRGYLLDDNEVKKAARDLRLPLIEINSFKDEEAQGIRDFKPDLFVVASFGLIVPRWALDLPTVGPVNVHPSLLPLYRGPSPMQWAILNGDEETGITLIIMNEKMDEGRIIYQERASVKKGENMAGLSGRLSARVAEILPGIVDRIDAQGMIEGTEQRHEDATYTPIITKEMGRIDWLKSAAEIERQVKAFVMWPVAYTFLDGRMMKLFDAEAEEITRKGTGQGVVAGITKEGFFVETPAGLLKVLEVQLENKKRMGAYDFAQGYRGLVGKVLGQQDRS
ncbi:MAG TPA: methionyl-tRNA formyltransferase [Syntrophorhabdaceae bacterium]|nr:methionyl-tRNA formyltransferase [Syntrophorhabdaceae bacterium]